MISKGNNLNTDLPHPNIAKVLIVTSGIIKYQSKILIMQRQDPSPDYPDSSKWEFPGGKLDHGFNLNKNLHRELKEETGLAVKVIKENIVVVDTKSEFPKYNGYIKIDLLSLVEPISSPKVMLSEEHSNYKWISYNEIESFDLSSTTINFLKQIDKYHKTLLI